MYDVNVLGTLHVTQALLPALRASGDGLIVNMGSTAGRVVYEGGGGYTAAKHALKALTGTLRLELCGEPIRVTEVAPGMVRTDEFAAQPLRRRPRRRPTAVYAGVAEPARRPTTSPTSSAGSPPGPATSTSTRSWCGRAPRPPSTRCTASPERPPTIGQTALVQTIGLVGGMSWESSAVYYRDLNLGVQQRLGGLSSPRLVLSTVDFAELTDLEEGERWDQIGELLAEAGRGVERAGADFLLLCTTTFHKVADQVEAAVDIPLLHLADVVAEACLAQGATTVGFIGTKVAMEDEFFAERLGRHGVSVIMPAAEHHDWLNSAIYDELVHGRVVDATRRRVVALTEELWDAGARRDPARLHRDRAARLAGRRRAARHPLHHPARQRRPRPRAGLTPIRLRSPCGSSDAGERRRIGAQRPPGSDSCASRGSGVCWVHQRLFLRVRRADRHLHPRPGRRWPWP